MNLSDHFTLAELSRSEAADRKGYDNTPTPEARAALDALCDRVLEPLRLAVGKPIRVNSAYRGPKANKAVGGSSKSQHLRGEAADIEVQGMSNKALAQLIIELKLPFDQLILEGYKPAEGPNSGWVHVSHAYSGKQRGQVLTATFVNGKAKYTAGLP
jgi:zinc D-Ala-D-Ala carboxypeptidase